MIPNYLFETLWWVMTAAACILAIIPALVRKISILLLPLIVGVWAGLLYLVSRSFGSDALWASLGASLLIGIMTLVLSLLFSGITSMLNNRYR
ncbi:hypothetical protein INT08_09335 [Prosthecochloris sp. N3]|uniref:Uncharacterized protein n=1 Tax=Prosthecochloris ethylica TaxID=2743976 RepID=A0ABR9XTM2_9CHLB|nr:MULTISPECIES: hypothetical protein [Prosthecochloris]MBF0586599.1 hypothetical protein [Prosthecochloris ethylica]MBF0637368.1 hypothetical protein [Prosthecochloris ethylica]NUK48322.1 hypothetical protein [Prosthecochloris ethylica]RNA65150.1 hypothetical protein CR163_007900 [Prosthecochloris sp. ZM_2]